MRKYRQVKWKSLPKSLSLTFLFGSGAVLAYEIHCLNRRFSSLLSDSALEKERQKGDCYITISQPSAEAEINGVISKFIGVEKLMETLMKGPASLGLDTNPWHLLRILNSKLPPHVQEHSKALKTLATTNYNAGLSQQIAQACGFKLSVKLARTKNVNLNLFLRPPAYLLLTSEPIEDALNNILKKIPVIHQQTCATYFLRIAQQITGKHKDDEYYLRWDPDIAGTIHPRSIIQIVELYLQALLQLSATSECSHLMVQNGLLLTLWRIVHAFDKEVVLTTLCTNIVANISLFPQFHHQIFQSGWIGLLAEFFGSQYASLNLAAGKALVNMDQDHRKYGVYDRSIYLLHPLYEEADDTRKSEARQGWDLDVVFVHGLLGGVGWTWRQSDLLGKNVDYTDCWPRDWLPADIPNLRILGIDYVTSLSQWKSRCPDDARRSTIAWRADQVLLSLKLAGIGRRPIVWIGHSMGGILLKQLLVNASKSSDCELQNLVKNTKALLMLSVPHDGSNVATLNLPARFLLLPSVEVEELRKGSSVLGNLNLEFKNLLSHYPIAVVSVVETKPTIVQPWGIEVKFVEPNSADLLSSGEVHFIPVDHYEICKPLNRKSFIYQRLIKLIVGVREGSPPKSLVQTT
ncbi:protein SERAC1-like [Daphnia carinata]|uniref:protein SERAC1-like n=1 Tax=Daphnia carinata TaxID=120202 RepID=UPI00257C08D7|nr:protein SERAC1-like [Daphnia carinata]